MKMNTNVVTDELKMNEKKPILDSVYVSIHAADSSTQPPLCHTRSLSNISNWMDRAAI